MYDKRIENVNHVPRWFRRYLYSLNIVVLLKRWRKALMKRNISYTTLMLMKITIISTLMLIGTWQDLKRILYIQGYREMTILNF
jgi:hypothetical protein